MVPLNRIITFALVALIAIGCTKQTSGGDTWSEKNEIKGTCSIAEAASKGMAVIFNTRLRNQSLFGDPYLGWPLENRKLVLEQLKKQSSLIIEIPDLALQQVAINPVDEAEVVESYNKVAADAGANYLLLLHAAGGIEASYNLFRVLYLTIIGAFIFPGNEGSGEASLQAFLYKSGSSKPCMTIETSGSSSQYRPYAFFDAKSLYMHARDRAFRKLLGRIK